VQYSISVALHYTIHYLLVVASVVVCSLSATIGMLLSVAISVDDTMSDMNDMSVTFGAYSGDFAKAAMARVISALREVGKGQLRSAKSESSGCH
jgi:hypothetical protein